ncbi:MAG: hypothetical protein AMXMBFR33_28190 [Candidatus Xenobia bacterium]
MSPFLAQLAELCRAHPTRAKWVFLPYRSLKWTLSEALLHQGTSWANLRLLTPFEMALEAAAPDLLAAGLSPKPEGLGPSLIHKLMLELSPKTPRHFAELLEQPGMAEALWTAVSELRMAGLTHRELGKALTGAKQRELTALLKAYEKFLKARGLADRATVYARASQTPVQVSDLVLEFPSTVWAPLERAFLDRLPGQKLRSRAPQLPLPRRLATSPRQAEQPKATKPRFFRAGRRDAEIMEVLRRIGSLKLDQVELACADPESFTLLKDKLAGLSLPATFERGLPLSLSRPGQALLGLLTWIEQRYSAFDLRELLLSRLVRPPDLDPSLAGSLLERSEATWERETYATHLARLKAWLLQRGQSEQAGQVEQLGKWIASLFRRLPVDARHTADWATWVRGLQSITDEHVTRRGPEDHAAHQRLTRAFDELLMLEGQRWSVEETVRWLRQKLEPLDYLGARALPGHLHVTTLDRVGLTARPHTFVLGLEEGRIGLGAVEDAILTDEERTALHPGLALSHDRGAERLHRIREQLANLTGAVTLSYSTRDLRSGQELLPSWLFFEAARKVHPLKSYEDLEHWLGEPVGYASPEVAASVTERWLLDPDPALESFPNLAAGRRAAEERASDRFTVYDGYVPSAAGRLDPRRTGEPVSASRLEGLAACPFRDFLERALRLRPLDLSRPDPDRWLDEAARGSLLHDLFATYHRELRRRGWRPDKERDTPRLEQLLEEALEAFRREYPPPSRAVERGETRMLKRDLECFLRLELSHPERTPIGCEVAFGQDGLEDEPLARAEPVKVMNLPLRGRIDRIDRLGQGIEVVDYKTGRRLKTVDGAVFQGGRLLQHALYALVAQELTGESVRGLSYCFPTTRGERPWLFFPSPDAAHLEALLQDVLEPLETGAFLHTESRKNDCTYCNFQNACRANTDEAARNKLAGHNPLLDYRRRAAEVP